MRFDGGRKGNLAGWARAPLTLATLMAVTVLSTVTLLIALPAATAVAQEITGETTSGRETSSGEVRRADDLKPFRESQANNVQAQEVEQAQASQAPGPLAGAPTVTLDRDGDGFTDQILIERNCTFRDGASLVLQDDDGTQGLFIDGENVRLQKIQGTLVLGGVPPGEPINPFEIRGGDGTLDGGGLTVATSTDIQCEADAGTTTPEKTTEPTTEPTTEKPVPGGNGGGNTNGETTGSNDNTDGMDEPSDMEPEPQDEDKGPLAGGTAFGNDVLVPGDIIDTLEDGTKVVGIDQIVIKTQNCKLTEDGEDLTLTLDDRGTPFRLRDGENVDISIKEDGTIIANGREMVGEEENPTRIIIPIPVKQGDTPGDQPNDKYGIISSTGIGGEGCQVVGDSAEAPDAANEDDTTVAPTAADRAAADRKNEVVPGTVPNKPLPNTGGLPVSVVVMSGLGLIAAGLAGLLRVSRRRP